MAYTTEEIIEWSKMSQAFSAIGEKKKTAFQGGMIDENLHIKIYTERKSLIWEYEQDSGSENLYEMNNWVYALCGIYAFQAQQASGGSGGSVSPITPATQPEQLNFTVAASGTPLIDGQTSKVFTDFVGYNLVVDKNGQPMTQITSAPIYYTWDRDTGAFTLNVAAATGDEFQITPV